MIKMRLFGNKDCSNCIEIMSKLKEKNIDFEYIDAKDMREEIQKFCDYYEVDDLPHLQFLDDNGKIVCEHIGPVDDNKMVKYMLEYLSL